MSEHDAIREAGQGPEAGRPSTPMSDFRHINVEATDDQTKVTLTESRIATEDVVQAVGAELYRIGETRGHTAISLDVRAVQFLSSSMLGKLLRLKKLVDSAGGTLTIRGVSPIIRNIFRTSGLEPIFVLRED